MRLLSQSWVGEAQKDGFILKKVVSDTTIAIGQPFSYTIYFTIPAGATNVTIYDQLPSNLQFLSHSFTSGCGMPTVTAPSVNSMGGTYAISWSSLPNGCSGSFTITVAFPNGVTCPGIQVNNKVCLEGRLLERTYKFCTPDVITKSVAVNPWHINKYPIGTASQGGNCPYVTGSDTITYQICVYKSVGTTGQLNLVNGIVTDTLPNGAQLVSSNCGATQTGNIVTWNIGNMSATQQYNTVCCQIKVYYSPNYFQSGSQITNSATLSGFLGDTIQPCSNFSIVSNKTCVELSSNIGPNVSINKWVYTNRQPGCVGQYLIYICNNGSSDAIINVTDTLPSQLTNYTLGNIWNLNATLTSGIVSIVDTLAPGHCGYVYINFTIPQNATIGSTITNCAYLFLPPNVEVACSSFKLEPPAPKPCVWKEVCNKQTDYTPGSVLRYRLRIQNIGGLPITNAIISDVLDPNLEYIGNPSSYIGNTWNIPCNSNPQNPWTGVNINYNPGTNTVTASIDSIPSTCQNMFYSNCGMYGTAGVPFYFIEFDVKVRDTSALGNIPNHFTISGGSLGNNITTSNTDYILVVGVVGYTLEKGVKLTYDNNYSTSLTTTPGSTVDFRLKMNSSGTAALRHVTFVDLLPRDNGTNDSRILQGCGNRGSQYDISYSTLISATPTIFSDWNNSATTLANVNNLTPTGAPGSVFTNGCGTAGSWVSSWSSGDKNIAAYLGPTAIGSSGATIDFSGIISNSAQTKQVACNSFAVSGWTKHLIQSSIPTFQLAGQLESPDVCITIDKIDQDTSCFKDLKADIKCDGLTPDGLQKYVLTVTASSCSPATLILTSPDGTFSPSTFAITSSSWTISTTFINTSTNNPVNIYYTFICNNIVCRDSIKWELPDCDSVPPPDKCCINFIRNIGNQPFLSNSSTGTVDLFVPIVAGPVPIKEFRATIVSAQLRKVCRKLNSTYPIIGPWIRIFGDIIGGNLVVPPAPGPNLLSIFSREAIWGPGDCISWMRGANLHLRMLFPPFSGSPLCHDTLRFAIRYSFTDCECRTCDTLIYYNIVRRKQFLPWEASLNTLKRGIKSEDENSKLGQSKLLSEKPEVTSFIMDDANNGSLWIISPDNPENNVIIKGVEIRSKEVELVKISNGNTNGFVQDDIAYVDADISAGNSSEIKLTFNNSPTKMLFTIEVRYKYIVSGFDEIFFTEPIEYLAKVPGGEIDKLDIDLNNKPAQVRTYALYFSNTNSYNQSIGTIGLKPKQSMKILAVGPPTTGNEQTYILPQRQDDGSYIITAYGTGLSGVDPKEKITPIYITLSGVDDVNAELDFTTFDEIMNEVSRGTVKLTNPISSVLNDGNEILNKAEIQSIIPNPANSQITVTLSLKNDAQSAKLSIIDLLGREVLSLTDNSLSKQGLHIYVIDVSKITNGTYFISYETNNATVTKPLSIIR